MRVLYVAWGFPPHRGPGTYRALASVDHLCSRGHDVVVLTADEEFFAFVTGPDESLLDRIDPRVQVVRVPYAPTSRDPVINRWPRARAMRTSVWRRVLMAREHSMFPENLYSGWRPRIEAAAYRLHRDNPFDLVIATGNPYVDFVVPMMLHAEFGVPFVLDDRDSWVLNVYTGEPHDGSEVQQEWLRYLLGDCLETWFVNPPIADWHRERYPELADRIHVVENGWDRTFLHPEELTHPVGGPLVFGYLGTINAGLPLADMIEGWRLARERGLSPDAELRLYGGLGHVRANRTQQLLIQESEAIGVRHMGRWPKARIAEAYRDIDVLVFAKEGGRMVTSGKVYEYVATGKPIAAVVETEHDSRRVLSAYPRVHLAADDHGAEAWAEAFLTAAADEDAHDPEQYAAAVEAGAAFRRDRLLGPALDRVLAAVGVRS